jgi:predicted metalloprotease with PDZ domain
VEGDGFTARGGDATVLDLLVRDATDGARSMDDVMRLMYTRFTTRGFTGADVENAVEEVCGCSAGEVFESYVRGANPIDFDRYLRLLGLRMSVAMSALDSRGEPLRDLRVWGWEEDNVLRLRVGDPGSIWGRAGLRTGDQLISINDAEIRTWPELRRFLVNFAIGDSANVIVQRPSGRFEARLVMRGYERPIVRVDPVAGASERQRRLRDAWLAGR